MFKDALPICSSEISVFVHLKLSFYHFFLNVVFQILFVGG